MTTYTFVVDDFPCPLKAYFSVMLRGHSNSCCLIVHYILLFKILVRSPIFLWYTRSGTWYVYVVHFKFIYFTCSHQFSNQNLFCMNSTQFVDLNFGCWEKNCKCALNLRIYPILEQFVKLLSENFWFFISWNIFPLNFPFVYK